MLFRDNGLEFWREVTEHGTCDSPGDPEHGLPGFWVSQVPWMLFAAEEGKVWRRELPIAPAAADVTKGGEVTRWSCAAHLTTIEQDPGGLWHDDRPFPVRQCHVADCTTFARYGWHPLFPVPAAPAGGEVPTCVDCGDPVLPGQQSEGAGEPLHGGCSLERLCKVPPEVQCCARFGATLCPAPAVGERGNIPLCAEHIASHDAGQPVPFSAAAAAAGGPAIPETPEHFKIRRCKTEVPGEEDGDPPRPCDAVLGSDLKCDVCGGLRCAIHCGSIDHVHGAEVISVHSVVLPGGRSLTAKLVRAGELFWGEVRKLHGSAIYAVPLKVQGDTADEVLVQLHAFMDAFPTVPPLDFDPPRVERAGSMLSLLSSSGDRGDETCSEADLFDPEDWQGVSPELAARALLVPRGSDQIHRTARAVLAHETRVMVLSFERCWQELAELADADPRTVARCKALHDACVVALLSAVGGAL